MPARAKRWRDHLRRARGDAAERHELDLWIDPRTHLIARVTSTIGIVSTTTTFSSYRRVDGITYPVRKQHANVDRKHLRRARLVTRSQYRRRRTYARTGSKRARLLNSRRATSTTVPLQIVNNHVYLNDVMLDGRGPYTFVLDSGGDYIVTPEVARGAASEKVRGHALQGVGSATEGASFAHIDSITIGSAVIRNQYMLGSADCHRVRGRRRT